MTSKHVDGQILTREELGELYVETKDEYDRYFSTWSNWCCPTGNPEEIKARLKGRMDAIAAQLGEDYMEIVRLREKVNDQKAEIKDVQKNNDELEDRIERLEGCVTELYQNKGDRLMMSKTYHHCESKIPMRGYKNPRTDF